MSDKQFIALLNEGNVAMLGALCPGMRFVQVGGMIMPGNDENMVLVSPKPKVIEPPPLLVDPSPQEESAVG